MRLTPQDFGVAIDGDPQQNAAGFAALSAAIAPDCVVNIPPGRYPVCGPAIECHVPRLTVLAHGALFVQFDPEATTVDLSKGACPGDTRSEVRWFGGRFRVAGQAGPNTCTAIRVLGVSRGIVAHVYASGHGQAAYEICPQDGFHLDECHGGAGNKTHVLVPDFWGSHSPGNPQSWSIRRCGFGRHSDAGIHIQTSTNDLQVEGCYFAGSSAVVLNGPQSNSVNVSLVGCTFEQGAPGEYFARLEPKPFKLRNARMVGCNFNGGSPRSVYLDDCHGVTLSDNFYASAQDGFITIGPSCKAVYVGRNDYLRGKAIDVQCAPSEVQYGWVS